MTRPRSRSISQNPSNVGFTKRYKRASYTAKRRLSPIQEGKHEDRSGSSAPKSKSSQKELIIVSRQKTLKRSPLHKNNKSKSNKSNKSNKKSSLINSIKNLFNF